MSALASPPAELRAAFEAVRVFHPTVNIALFLPDGTWRYYQTDGDGRCTLPEFCAEIDTDALETAQQAVEQTHTLPVVFTYEQTCEATEP